MIFTSIKNSVVGTYCSTYIYIYVTHYIVFYFVHSFLDMAGNCFWFMIARRKIVIMTKSLIPHLINSFIRLLMIISGLCLIGLSIFDVSLLCFYSWGYWEFLYCAIAEWVMVLGCILFTLVIALETQTYEDVLVRSKIRNITTIQLMKQV
ncbi:uncharacterized protein DC041_0010177 [Schistosoma bovis]|uniref:Uncharacterized protein n=1 Tax=Schistosoma bovis TaxID=6184 RepID=A0A430Q8E8_SCHBO|nr:uncharacterized protein DC041_0010177 [Schistosoma bovis]